MASSLPQRQLLRQLAQVRAPSRALVAAARYSSSQHPHNRCCFQTSAHSIHLYRCFSASSRLSQEQKQHPISPIESGTAPLPNAQAKPRRRRPRWFSATVLLLLGAIAGSALRVVLSPPPPPIPGSPADEALKEKIRKLAEELPIVQELQNEPGWTHHEAYAAFPATAKPTRITSGPLGTAASIGAYQHIFHPPALSLEPIIDIIFFGLSTTGWPGVVHGGLISTILDEHSARAALAETAGKGVLTAKLDVTYLRPTLAGTFYIVKARALREDELDESERGKRGRKLWVDVWLETMEGMPCVRGRALFVIPKGRELRGLEKGF